MLDGSRSHHGSSWVILAALWMGSACADGGSSKDSLAALGIDDGASKGETHAALVTASEETSIALKTGARLTIPEGAVDDDVEVVLKRPPDREALPLIKTLSPAYKVVSAPYVVTPHGKSFNKDIEISLPIAGGKQDRLAVAYLKDEDDKSWEIHGKPKVSGDTAKVAVDHFSVYVLLERLDAEEQDAGGSDTPDAESETPDGEVTGLDAGIDASVEARDAGQDAASAPDGSFTTSSFAARLVTRMRECGLIAQDGTLKADFRPLDSRQQCAAACLFDAACVDLAAQLCIDTQAGTEAYQTCILRCFSFSIVECLTVNGSTEIVASCDGHVQCMDGSDEANCPNEAFLSCAGEVTARVPVSDRCDGYLDCSDGSDEQSCPAGTHFVCDSGELLSSDAECDGATDCADGSDEARCPMFTCRNAAQLVPQAVVCNLERDCSDGSDEDMGCLKLTCDPRGDERIQP